MSGALNFQATILHLFGIDHERFTVNHRGLDAKLTGVLPARVVRAILAQRSRDAGTRAHCTVCVGLRGRGHGADAGADEYVFALDATTGELVWETQILDYKVHPANQTSGPIIANGKVIPELNLVYIGTSVTSPAPKFLIGGVENKHLYHNSTLALDVDTGDIVWYYQHLKEHWDLDHP